jgi:hypothetical protein
MDDLPIGIVQYKCGSGVGDGIAQFLASPITITIRVAVLIGSADVVFQQPAIVGFRRRASAESSAQSFLALSGVGAWLPRHCHCITISCEVGRIAGLDHDIIAWVSSNSSGDIGGVERKAAHCGCSCRKRLLTTRVGLRQKARAIAGWLF